MSEIERAHAFLQHLKGRLLKLDRSHRAVRDEFRHAMNPLTDHSPGNAFFILQQLQRDLLDYLKVLLEPRITFSHERLPECRFR